MNEAQNPSLTQRTREAATHAVESTRGAATHAIDTTRNTASKAAHKTATGIESSPLAALVGGAAIGVAIGALLPRTEKERQTLGPIGKRLTDGAAAAARSARDAGKQEIESLMPDKQGAKDRAATVLGNVAKAAREGAKTGV